MFDFMVGIFTQIVQQFQLRYFRYRTILLVEI